MDNIKEKFSQLLEKLADNQIELRLTEEKNFPAGISKFGGNPDLPKGFEWPHYNGRPLSFLAQIDLKEAAKYDSSRLLPESGTLSFFYDIEEQPWGYDPKDIGCSKVLYFPEGTELVRTSAPDDMPEYCTLDEFRMSLTSSASYPCLSELEEYAAENGLPFPEYADENEEDEVWDSYQEWTEQDVDMTKLLGYSDIVQNPMREQCEEVAGRGFYLGNGDYSKNLTDEEIADIKAKRRDWRLLFQLGDDIAESIGTMFGDCGNIYFWIRKQDLAERRFDKVWCILQCG